MGYNQVTITTSPAKIVSANTGRLSIIFSNEGTANTVFVGPDASVTATNSVGIVAGGSLSEDSGGTRVYLGDYYAATLTGTSVLSYWER